EHSSVAARTRRRGDRMRPREFLTLPSPAPSTSVVMNARCSLRIEADRRVIVVAGRPMHHYRAEDAVAEAYAMVFLVESGFAKQTDVARAFARSVRTIRRYRERYAHGGMVALGRKEGWRRGRRRISGKRQRSIEMMKSQGMSNRTIAHWRRQREGHPQPGRTFEVRRERTASVGRDQDSSGEAGGDWRAVCKVDRRTWRSRHSIGEGERRRL